MAIAKSFSAQQIGFAKAAIDLTSGIEVAIAVAGPVIAASVVLEIGAALIARSSSPTQIHVLLAPLRSFGILAIFALCFDRIAHLLALFSQSHPAQ
jgi:type III secretory pathway component EscT